MPDEICFPNHQGVPFQPDPPTVDGYVEPETAMSWVFGSAAANVDTGWSGASKETFGDATAVGLSSPLVAFQGVKHNSDDYVYLSFIIRRDPDFADEDRIVLVFHPNFAAGSVAKTGDERRIDIQPLEAGVGAGTAAPNEADTWGITIGSVGFKTDRSPANVEYYEWDMGSGTWSTMVPPSNVDIKVRSWDGGTNNRNWSVEVKLPVTIAEGGTDWIDFTSHFGFYFNVIRTSGAASVGLDFATQFTWPLGGELDDNGGLLDLDQIEIEPSKLGDAVLGSGADCTAVAGVKFDGGYGSIGARVAGTGGAPSSSIEKFLANEFVAQILNDDSVAADNITAEFRIANWGIGPGTLPKWNKIVPDAGHFNPSASINLAPGSAATPTTGELTTQWTLSGTEQGEYGTTLDSHQCIWVKLESNQTVSFVESTMKRNMNVVPLSEYEQEAEISGVGWPDEGGDHEFILLTSQIAMARHLEGKDRRSPKDHVTPDTQGPLLDPFETQAGTPNVVQQAFVTVVDGYRRTTKTLTIDGKRMPVYAYSDSFGHTGVHQGAQEDELSFALSGPSLLSSGQGSYRISVPQDGVARITASLTARPPAGAGGWLAWLRRLLRGLIRFIRWLVRLIRNLFGGGS